MKGNEKLWGILNDKLDMLRASNRLPEAIRIAETALDLAQRAFQPGDKNYTLSLEKLGQLHDQAGDRVAAKPYLVKAHGFLEKAEPIDGRALFRSARRLGFLWTISAKPMLPSGTMRLPLSLAPNWRASLIPISGRC